MDVLRLDVVAAAAAEPAGPVRCPLAMSSSSDSARGPAADGRHDETIASLLRLVNGGTGLLEDAEEERRFRAETLDGAVGTCLGGGPDNGGVFDKDQLPGGRPYHGCASAEPADAQLECGRLQAAAIALLHAVFLAGLPCGPVAAEGYGVECRIDRTAAPAAGRCASRSPGAEGDGGRCETVRWLRAATAAASALAAAWPSARLPGGGGARGERRRVGAMHAAFMLGCAAMAWADPEPFLFVGASAGVVLACVARPTESATVLQVAAGAALLAFSASLWLGSARAGLPPPTAIELAPLAFLWSFVGLWARADNTTRRVGWLLTARRRRRRAEVWAALADLLPEHVIPGLCRGEAAQCREGRAMVLFADLVGYTGRWHALQVRVLIAARYLIQN
jgi:hypothetical protein